MCCSKDSTTDSTRQLLTDCVLVSGGVTEIITADLLYSQFTQLSYITSLCQGCQLIAGLVASGSILIEKKSRRSELALYVMPRAVDAFVLALTKKRWVPSVKFGEVILFSLCMGGLMYYR